ncbi:hypothetical protein KAU40_00575 [Candidatus Parcubacteria bacterium]|nr:hypothetical protein [Candidatus Parcubacteria bacterium]
MGILDSIKKSLKQQKKSLEQQIEEAKRTVHLTYLGGHPDISSSMPIRLKRENDNLNLYRYGGYGGEKFLTNIPLSAIKSVQFQRAGSRSLGKAAAGAIGGGILLGPLGLIVGGALGGKKKDESVIVVTIQHDSMELQILFGSITGKKGIIERKYSKFVQLIKP